MTTPTDSSSYYEIDLGNFFRFLKRWKYQFLFCTAFGGILGVAASFLRTNYYLSSFAFHLSDDEPNAVPALELNTALAGFFTRKDAADAFSESFFQILAGKENPSPNAAALQYYIDEFSLFAPTEDNAPPSLERGKQGLAAYLMGKKFVLPEEPPPPAHEFGYRFRTKDGILHLEMVNTKRYVGEAFPLAFAESFNKVGRLYDEKAQANVREKAQSELKNAEKYLKMSNPEYLGLDAREKDFIKAKFAFQKLNQELSDIAGKAGKPANANVNTMTQRLTGSQVLLNPPLNQYIEDLSDTVFENEILSKAAYVYDNKLIDDQKLSEIFEKITKLKSEKRAAAQNLDKDLAILNKASQSYVESSVKLKVTSAMLAKTVPKAIFSKDDIYRAKVSGMLDTKLTSRSGFLLGGLLAGLIFALGYASIASSATTAAKEEVANTPRELADSEST